MHIHLLRHGDAEGLMLVAADAERALTPAGRRQAEETGAWFRRHGITLEAVVCSPLVRAKQMADLAAAPLGLAVRTDERLSPGRLGADSLVEMLEDSGDPESLLLVGHEPDLGLLVRELTGAATRLGKAALALVTCERPHAGGGELVWLISYEVR